MMLLYYIVVITRLCFCIFQNMRKQLLTALVLGLAEAIFISENVIFHKTNEISITRAKWLATFIIDLRPFRQFLAKQENYKMIFTWLQLLRNALLINMTGLTRQSISLHFSPYKRN